LLALALATSAPLPADQAAPAETPAPLLIDGQTIMVFRSAFLGLTPQQRAQGAELRVKEFLREYGYSTIAARPTPQGAAVLIHGEIMFIVTPGDIGGIPGASLQSTAEEAAHALAGLEWRERVQQYKRKLTGIEVAPKKLLLVLGAVGMIGAGFYGTRFLLRRKQNQPLICPNCENADQSLFRFEDDYSSFRGVRKFYCDACGYKWIKKGGTGLPGIGSATQ
jgi:hypothetical protein